jgi:fructose transport system substrate-binding protein
MVIALDSPTDPVDGTDALFATDNYKAGELIGQYAKAAAGRQAGQDRHAGPVPRPPGGRAAAQRLPEGLRPAGPDAKSNELGKDAAVVCMADSFGDRAKGQTAMENCLQKNPDINIVYTINEPAAAGAYNALKKAGKEKGVIIVSVDGGCAGIKDVGAGVIAATSQQYPLKMAAMGVAAGVEYAKTARRWRLHRHRRDADRRQAVAGVDSKDVKTGTDLCWGAK